MSTNIEDRRRRSDVAPYDSAGYPVAEDADLHMDPALKVGTPDINEPVPQGAPTFDAKQQEMGVWSRMNQYAGAQPLKKRRRQIQFPTTKAR
jgi:hypothetical protein